MIVAFQDFWESPQRRGPFDIDQLTKERRGQYLVPVTKEGVPSDALAHIASRAYFGEESSGGSIDIEMMVYCRADISDVSYSLQREAPAGQLVCRTCRREYGYFLVDQANP